MKTETLRKMENIINLIDSLKNSHVFYDENNEEEFLNEIEAAIVSIDEMVDIIERDISYKAAMEWWLDDIFATGLTYKILVYLFTRRFYLWNLQKFRLLI